MPAGSRARTHGWLLWALLSVFLLRVIAQPLALVVDVPFLPHFDDWHSGVLPYAWLVASQIVMLGVLTLMTVGVWRQTVSRRRAVGLVTLGIGILYCSVMVIRLVLGFTALRGHGWFDRPLPTVVHLAVATFLLVYGHYHFREIA